MVWLTSLDDDCCEGLLECWGSLLCGGWFHCRDTCSMEPECVWALAVTLVSTWCATSLTVLVDLWSKAF
jgi:hypothetical protein